MVQLDDAETRERKSTSIVIPVIEFALALMGVVTTFLAVRETLPMLAAGALCLGVAASVFLADRARRRRMLDPGFGVAALLLVTCLIAVIVLQHRDSVSARVFYSIDPQREAPMRVPGIEVKAGEFVHITYKSGTWTCDPANKEPLGLAGARDAPYSDQFLVRDAPYCALVARIGNDPWSAVGDDKRFFADTEGGLYLTANDMGAAKCPPEYRRCYADNAGEITVDIRVDRKGD